MAEAVELTQDQRDQKQREHELAMQTASDNAALARQAAATQSEMEMQAKQFEENELARKHQARQSGKDRAVSYMNNNQKQRMEMNVDFTGGQRDSMQGKFGNNSYMPRSEMMKEYKFDDR